VLLHEKDPPRADDPAALEAEEAWLRMWGIDVDELRRIPDGEDRALMTRLGIGYTEARTLRRAEEL
jgi:hypothetical protein